MNRFKKVVAFVLIMAVMLTGSMAVTVQNVSAASDPQVASTKVVTKTTTKTTNKSVKMKNKAKKSKTTTKITTKKSSKITSKTSEKKVKQDKTVKTTVKTTLTKKSKIKKIKTTVKTTIKTTTTTYKKKNVEEKKVTVADIRKAVPADALGAFDQLGFKISINENLKSVGVFSTEKHSIQLRYASAGALLHEMGHFISCLQDSAAESDEFTALYKAEKDKYTGTNKSYVTADSDEYFAESYRDYIERPDTLKKERPGTYNYMKKHAHDITQDAITMMAERYGSNW